MDECGVDPAAFEDAVRVHRGRIAFACMTPTFHNPTGLVVSERRRRELLAAADRHGVLIVEDDAYADLVLDGAVPPSMVDIAGHDGVVRLRTFSKTLAPGLRLGFLVADPRTVTRLAEHALFVSGGSANHLASLAVAHLIASGAYDRHLAWLRAELRQRRDALVGGLQGLTFDVPAGGYFLWLRSDTRPESALLAAAEEAGVRVSDGSRFGAGPSAAIRLSYSFNPPSDLAAAGGAFAAAWSHRSVKETTP
jgi:DNA-binding transcriptional MocR family regulator